MRERFFSAASSNPVQIRVKVNPQHKEKRRELPRGKEMSTNA